MPDAIPFTRGVPAADLIPVDDMREATARALDADAVAALSYAPGGYRPLREWIGARHGVDAGRVLITNGSLQALGFLGQHFFADGDGAAVVEAPTYDRTLKILRRAGADLHAVPLDPDGIDVDRLAALLAGGLRPRLVYLIPTYQNPSGSCASLERRQALVDAGPPVRPGACRGRPLRPPAVRGRSPPDAARARRRRARHLLLVLHEDRRAGRSHGLPGRAGAAGAAAGGALGEHAHRAEHARGGRARRLLRRRPLRAERRQGDRGPAHAPRRDGGGASGAFSRRRPLGDTARRLFLLGRAPDGIDTTDALAAAVEQGVPYVKGADFFVAEGGRDSVRLAYSACPADRIDEGIARLAGVLSSQSAAVA